jgi:competence ComEA-like helix-hairpin-helix protein
LFWETNLGEIMDLCHIKNQLWRFKKSLITAAMMTSMLLGGYAYAIDINTATQETLEAVKGVGPTRAKAIIAERDKGGSFQSIDDLSQRVKGIGQKTITKMQESGLNFEGRSSPKSSKTSRTRQSQ